MAEPKTSDRPSDQQLFARKASFIQHSLPGLDAGAYEIEVRQSFETSGGKPVYLEAEAPPAVTRRFGVQGPRYSLPASAVHSVYPPANAAGGFSNSIAHVVLDRERLPWIRSPYPAALEPTVETRSYTTTYGGQTHDVTYEDDKSTWLAVLLLTPDDLGGQDPERALVQGDASDLVPDVLKVAAPGGAMLGGLAADGYSIFSYFLETDVAGQTISAGVGHTADEACTYIDVPAALFSRLVPSVEDLEMIAHVRAVEMDAKPIPDEQSVDPVTRYSIVVGNRLPQTTPVTEVPPATQPVPAVGRNVALLVSLENMIYALRGAPTGSYYAKSVAKAAGGFVRLIVLHSWSFVSWHDTSFDFERILKSLNGREPDQPNGGADAPSDAPTRVRNPLMRRPDPPSYATPTPQEAVVQDMLQLGYTPMTHLTRVPDEVEGETEQIRTVSWYRGPFVPFRTPISVRFVSGSPGTPATQTPLVYSADQLLRYDPDVGMYDTCYAAAWQLGRLVSLQDKSFSVPLYRWKMTTEQAFRMMLEDQVLQQDFDAVVARFRGLLSAEGRVLGGSPGDKLLYRSVVNLLAGGRPR